MRSTATAASLTALLCATMLPAQERDSTSSASPAQNDSGRVSLWRREPSERLPDFHGRVALLAQRNFFSVQAGVRAIAPAAIAQVTNTPDVWGRTAEGFGRRLGRNVISSTSRDLLQGASAAAFQHDPRYQSCDCRGAWRRIGHALTGVVLFGDGSGGRRFGAGSMIAAAGGGLVDAHLYEPGPVEPSDIVRRGSTLLLRTVVTNVAFEFRSDLRRVVRRVTRRRE